MLVEPHNHCVNAVKCAIQTFKNHFVSVLAMIDSKILLQLWDWLALQVKNTLNILQPSCIDLTKWDYEAIHGPYNWNRFPLAPPGCKAVIYESPKARPLWGSHGIDAWYVGPLLNHYQCNHYFVPKSRAYCISGSAELFPQHYQVLFLMWNKHLHEVIDKLMTTLKDMSPKKQARILTLVKKKITPGHFKTPKKFLPTLFTNGSCPSRCAKSAIHPLVQTKGDTCVGTKDGTKGAHTAPWRYSRSCMNNQCPSYHGCTKPHSKTIPEIDKTNALTTNV